MYKAFTASELKGHFNLPPDYKIKGYISYGAYDNEKHFNNIKKVLKELKLKYTSRNLGKVYGFLSHILEIKIKGNIYWFSVNYGSARLSEYLHLACLFGSKKNIHITIKFMQEASEEQIKEVKSRLKTIKFNSFKTALKEKGLFPNEKNARVIWVSIELENRVIELQQRIDEKLIDLLPDNQEFKSHITIGRIKSIKNTVISAPYRYKTEPILTFNQFL